MTRLLQDRLETEKKNILQEKEVRNWDRWRGNQAPAGQAGDREEEYSTGEGGKELGQVERVTRLLQDRLETEKKNILQEKEVRSWGR